MDLGSWEAQIITPIHGRIPCQVQISLFQEVLRSTGPYEVSMDQVQANYQASCNWMTLWVTKYSITGPFDVETSYLHIIQEQICNCYIIHTTDFVWIFTHPSSYIACDYQRSYHPAPLVSVEIVQELSVFLLNMGKP